MATSGSKSVEVVPGLTMVLEWRLTLQNPISNDSHVYGELKLVSDGTVSISNAGLKWIEYHLCQHNARVTRSVDVEAGKTTVVYGGNGLVVKHEEDGTLNPVYQSFRASIEFGTIGDTYIGTKEVSMRLGIPPINRAVTISVSNAVLGEESVISVARYVKKLSHTILWWIGDGTAQSGTICEKSQNDVETFVAPIELSSLNTTSDTVRISLSVVTYDGDREIADRLYNITYTMPPSVAPSCVFSIDDSLKYKYIDYVQSKSSLRVVTTPSTSYGASIVSCQVFVDDGAYSGTDVTTKQISSVGEIPVIVKVTDTRGRSYSETKMINVIAYTPPSVIALVAERANADGSDNEQGEHVKATFSAGVTPLNNKNSAVYKLGYKKTAHLGYTELDVSEYAGEYSLTDIVRIFAADTGSSYDVRLSITDDFHTTIYEAKAPTGFTIFHVPASGHGFSFGKVSEVDNLFDVAFVARFIGGFMQPEIENGTDFDDVVVPNTYACSDASKAGYLHSPFEEGEFVFEVMATASGLIQRAVACEIGKYRAVVRCLKDDEWGDWTELGGSIDLENLITYTDNAYGGQTMTIGV